MSGDDDSAEPELRQAAHVSDIPIDDALSPTLDGPESGFQEPQVEDLQPAPREAYRIIAEVAHGGMGRVLRAHDRRLGRPVAVKELLRKSPSLEARFVREAFITARLQHPSIVPIYDAGRGADGKPFYVMKLVSGRSLADSLHERTTLASRLELLPVVIAVGEAMAYAHSKRVIHRDLKPSNVMVGDFGETLVIDWGLAKWLGSEPEQLLSVQLPSARGETGVGNIVGTPGYMAPEQAKGDPADLRSDVYSLGRILRSVLTGRSSSEELPLPPGTPEELAAIIARATAPRAEDRYPSALELTADLKRFQAGQLVAAHRYSRSQLVIRWISRHRLAVAVAAAVLLSTTLTVSLGFRRVLRERDRADLERDHAEAARQREAARSRDLILAEARRLLESDPTLAVAWLELLEDQNTAAVRLIAWEAQARGVAERRLQGHAGAVSDVMWLGDGSLVSAGEAGEILRWRDQTPEPVAKLDGRWRVVRVGAILAALGPNGELRRWRDHRPEAVAQKVTAIATSGASLWAAGADGLVRWPADGASAAISVEEPVTALAVSRDDRVLALASAHHTYVIAGGKRRALPHADVLALAADGRWLALGGGETWLFDLASGKQRRMPARGTAALLRFSPDGAALAQVNQDGSADLWRVDRPDAAPLELIRRGSGRAGDVAFSPDGTRLAVSRGQSIRLWDLRLDEELKLHGHTDDITRLSFSPDGARLVSASADRTLRVWSLDRLPKDAQEAPPSERSLEASLPGGLRASAGRSVVLVEAGGAVARLPGRVATPIAVAGAPDGGLLAYYADGVARKWPQLLPLGELTTVAHEAR